MTGLTQDTVMTLSRVFDEATFSLCLLLTCCAVSLPSVWSSVSCMHFRIIKDSPALCASLFVALPLSSNDQMPSVFWCILKKIYAKEYLFILMRSSGWVKLSSLAVLSSVPVPLYHFHWLANMPKPYLNHFLSYKMFLCIVLLELHLCFKFFLTRHLTCLKHSLHCSDKGFFFSIHNRFIHICSTF